MEWNEKSVTEGKLENSQMWKLNTILHTKIYGVQQKQGQEENLQL